MKKYSPKLKAQALEDHINGKTLEQIAKDYKAPFETVKTWHKVGNWAKEKEDHHKETSRKLAERLTDLEVNYNFNIIQEYVKELQSVDGIICDKAIEELAKKRTKRELLKDIAQIAGYFNQTQKHDVKVEVIPIMGLQKTNVCRNDSNKENI